MGFWNFPRNQCEDGTMPNDLPDDAHRVPQEKAVQAEIADPNEPALEEVLERIAARRGGRVSLNAAVEHIRTERDYR
jgi:hypothetical protein